MKSRINICFAIGILLLLTTCGDNIPASTNDDDPVDPNVESKEIGPAGGNITSKDGLLTLTIPAGALSGSETITIEKIAVDDLGSEFSELTEAGAISEAYEMGPDGLQFDEPITVKFKSSQTPVQTADSIGAFSEFLLTSSGSSVEFLDSLVTHIDIDNSKTEVEGQLSHFSPLVTSQANNGVSFFVFGVPDKLEIGSIFSADANIFGSASGSLAEIVTVPGPATYKDRSGTPIVPVSDPPSGELTGNSADGFTGSFNYGCSDEGLGIYSSDLSVQVVFNLNSEEIRAESFANFLTTVECVPEALPAFTLTAELAGDGAGTVTSEPTGIDCPGDCTEDYTQGNDVILDANPAEGSEFVNWTGDIGANSPEDPVITLTMDQNRNVTAVFSEIPSFTLEVLKNGDGTGTVTSDPPGIDYGDDNTEDYPENTVVTLTVTPDEGSIFKNWSENGTILSTASSIDITMDQARSVTATFGVPASVNGVLIALRALPINAVITYIETAIYVRFLNSYLLALNQQSNGMGLVNASQAERLPLLVQGAEGFIIFDLISDEVLLDFTGLPNNGSVGNRTPLGALAVSRPNPGPDTPAVLASYAQDSNNSEFGFNLFPYDPEMQEFIKGPVSPYPSTVDAFPIGGDGISDEVVIVREGGFGINFLRFSETVGEYLFRPSTDGLPSARYGFEQPVTAYGEEVEGALLVVNEVGDLYFEPRKGFGPTVLIGNLGQRIIRIRCELPICVATDIDGNALRIITWDGQTQPTIIGNPVTAGAGPVDPDLYTLPNGNILIVVTGFNDNSISILEVAGNGSVISNKLYETPQGCENPGHVIIEENTNDAANPMIIGTCYESANYFVNDLLNTTNLFTQIGGM